MTSESRQDARSCAVAQQVCAWLLTYPDDRLFEKIPLLAGAVLELPDDTRHSIEAFLDYLARTAGQQVQEHYVATFDMRRKCSLFLTYWTHGDTRNRGMALLHFKQTYRTAGVVPSEEELPDHLAVVLEFAAIGDSREGNLLLGEHRAPIELIRDALHSANSYYAFVLDAVVATLPPMTAEIAERAKALALSGPPQEFVGLSGAVSIALQPFSATSELLAEGART